MVLGWQVLCLAVDGPSSLIGQISLGRVPCDSALHPIDFTQKADTSLNSPFSSGKLPSQFQYISIQTMCHKKCINLHQRASGAREGQC